MFRGQQTVPIPADATAELLEHYIESLSTVSDVDVVYHGGGVEGSLCSEGGTTAEVTFKRDHGDLPVSKAHSVSTFLSQSRDTSEAVGHERYLGCL